MLIEQAVFGSAKTERAQGYQLLGRSEGLSEHDAQELELWGPSHESLLDSGEGAQSVNFHRLASGNFCVSRTTVAGTEYSGRGGSVYTQFLVLTPELLARFANNPFSILRSALASGALCVSDEVPRRLQPLRIAGRAAAVDLLLLAQLARKPGPAAVARLLRAALSSDRLAVFSQFRSEQILAGLMSVLPVKCRTAFSFATGLKISTARAIRISKLPADRSAWPAIVQQGTSLLDLEAEHSDAIDLEGWPECVRQYLLAGKLSAFAALLDRHRPWLDCDNLDPLAEEAMAKLNRTAPHSVDAPPKRTVVETMLQAASRATTERRADAAHARFAKVKAAMERCASASTVDDLAEVLADQPPQVLELLERIDDLIFAAIRGNSQSLAELEVAWPLAASELDEDVVEQSREQYLRCAMSIWNECSEGHAQRPELAAALVDVLCVLLEHPV